MPTLAEKKDNLIKARQDLNSRFEWARTQASDAEAKEFAVNERERRENDIKSLVDEIARDEQLELSQRENDEALKAALDEKQQDKAPDRQIPYSVKDAAKTADQLGAGYQYDLDQFKGLGELIADSEAFKSFKDGKTLGARKRGFEIEGYKSILEGTFSGPHGGDAYAGMIEDNLKSLPGPVQEAMRDAYKSYKATFTTTGLTNYDRPSGIVLQGVMMPHVADLIPQGETGAPTIRYQREVSFTPSATAVAEGALKPEAVWSVGEVDAPVRKIAVIARTTEELLEDYPAFRDYVNQRTPFMVQIEEDNQLLNGNGTAPNLRGILNTSGILTHAMGMDVDETTAVADDTAPDAILRGITRVQAESYFVPTANVLNPFDWMRIRLLRSGTGDAAGGAGRGVYLFGPPSEPGVQTLWGLVNVLTTRIAQLTVLSGAFNVGAQIFRRKGLTVEMTNTDGEDWRYNRVAIRAEQREALAVYLPQAFVRTTLT